MRLAGAPRTSYDAPLRLDSHLTLYSRAHCDMTIAVRLPIVFCLFFAGAKTDTELRPPVYRAQ